MHKTLNFGMENTENLTSDNQIIGYQSKSGIILEETSDDELMRSMEKFIAKLSQEVQEPELKPLDTDRSAGVESLSELNTSNLQERLQREIIKERQLTKVSLREVEDDLMARLEKKLDDEFNAGFIFENTPITPHNPHRKTCHFGPGGYCDTTEDDQTSRITESNFGENLNMMAFSQGLDSSVGIRHKMLLESRLKEQKKIKMQSAFRQSSMTD